MELHQHMPVYWVREKLKARWISGWEPAFRLLLISSLAFPVFGTTVKCNHFAALKSANSYAKFTMEGIYYMSWRYKGRLCCNSIFEKKHAQRDDVVLEATGPAFSHYGRISASTGLDTLLGWANHENIWRDGTWKTVNVRSNEIKTIYTSSSIPQTKQIMDKYKIKYVMVGGARARTIQEFRFQQVCRLYG